MARPSSRKRSKSSGAVSTVICMARLVAKSMPRDVRLYVNMCETRLYRKAAASSMQAAASSRTSASKKQSGSL